MSSHIGGPQQSAQGLDIKDYGSYYPPPPAGAFDSFQQSTSHQLSSMFQQGSSNSTTSGTSGNASVRNGYFEQLAGIGLGVGSLMTEILLSHPCIVLRRQCQVHVDKNAAYHTTPFTLIPVVYNLHQNQGVVCLWKGVLGSVVVKGLTYAIEILASDLLGLTRNVSDISSREKVWKHFVLKGVAFLLTTPFVAAAFVETVQFSALFLVLRINFFLSWITEAAFPGLLNIALACANRSPVESCVEAANLLTRVRSDVASERPGLFDCIRNGFGRISHDLWLPRDSSRRIPMWTLIPPSVTYRIFHYCTASVAHYFMYRIVKKHVMRKSKRSRTIFDNYFPDLFAAFTSLLAADAVLFPFETVLNRMYLQGTRAIIDNLDHGHEVIPFNSRYEGFFDCIRSIRNEEGLMGFYKGFGALALQYCLHFLILRLTRLIIEQLEESFARPPPPLTPPMAPANLHNQPMGFQDRQSPPTFPSIH